MATVPFTQIPDISESSHTRACFIEIELIPQSFLDAMDDFENGRVTDIPEDF